MKNKWNNNYKILMIFKVKHGLMLSFFNLNQTTEEKEELVAHIGSLENQVRAGMSGDHVEPALVEEFEKKVSNCTSP